MAKLAPPKKASKPTAPKKPTSRSKTGNAACSEAASNWQLSLRGKASLDPETYRTLAKCRAMNRTSKMAEAQGRTGKLSAMGEQAVKARLQARFDSGLITAKSRSERLDMLLKQRSQRGNQAVAKSATTEKQPWEMTPHEWQESQGWDVGFHDDQRNLMRAMDVRTKEILAGKGIIRPSGSRNVKKQMRPADFRKAESDAEMQAYKELHPHRKIIEDALKSGKPVPQSVLSEYPGIAPPKPAARELKQRAKRGKTEAKTSPLAMSAEEQKIRERYREIAKTSPQNPVKTVKPEAVRRAQSDDLVTVYQSNEQFRGTPLPYTFAPPAMPKTSGEAIPPKPAARYSLGGKLAPGRGTEERKKTAASIKEQYQEAKRLTEINYKYFESEYHKKYHDRLQPATEANDRAATMYKLYVVDNQKPQKRLEGVKKSIAASGMQSTDKALHSFKVSVARDRGAKAGLLLAKKKNKLSR